MRYGYANEFPAAIVDYMKSAERIPDTTSGAFRESNRSLVSQLRRSPLFRNYQPAFEKISGLPLTMREAGSFQAPLHDSRLRNPFCILMAASNRTGVVRPACNCSNGSSSIPICGWARPPWRRGSSRFPSSTGLSDGSPEKRHSPSASISITTAAPDPRLNREDGRIPSPPDE